VACGGDGTFNLVARAALRADIPVGCLPLGRFNNIARSLNPTADPDKAIEKIISRGYRTIDTATAAGLPFFGSVGLGFVAKLLEQLQKQDVPRLSFGWSQLGARAASEVRLKRTILKVDAFRFEIRPIILSINLLSYSAGLPLTPASIPDDGLAEVVFDQGNNAGSFSAFTRLTLRKKYLYGDDVRLYRGRAITCQSVKGSTLYLDGELIELPDDTLEIRISDKKLHVFS
jgi:diacylglycerol kinase family enzyme